MVRERWAVPIAILLLLASQAASETAAGGDSAAPLREQLSALREELAAQRELIQAQRAELAAAQARRLAGSSLARKVAALEKNHISHEGAMDSRWLILCGALVMFMHAGFAMLECGSCRAKNASNILMKNLVNVCFGTLGWWVVGWALAYGGPMTEEGKLDGFVGTRQFFGTGFTSGGDGKIEPLADGAATSPMLAWFFQWAFSTAGASIVSGGVAERLRGLTYASFAFFMTSFIYPVVVAWTWGRGWLSSLFGVGVTDFAGSGVVHLTGGVSALAGAYVLGPREGMWRRPEEEFEPHNVPLIVLGTFVLWSGWFGFNAGSTLGMHSKEAGALAAQVAMNTTLSPSVCGITLVVLRYWFTCTYDLAAFCNGVLSGLVSITAGCGNVESGSAVAIGLIGAFVYEGASALLQRYRIDDPVGASCVHGACGAWGLLAAALFDWGRGFDHHHGEGGWVCTEGADGCVRGTGGKALGAQIVMILTITAWAGTLSGTFFTGLKTLDLLRVKEETERLGLDAAKHAPPRAYSLSASMVGDTGCAV